MADGSGTLGSGDGAFSLRDYQRRREGLMEALLAACAGLTLLLMVAVVLILVWETFQFLSQVSFWEFFTETHWTPLFREKHFGILPLLSGSVMVVAGGALVAIPGGLLTAIFLAEYASPKVRWFLKPALDVLGGIPTVVYGYFALTFVTPLLRVFFPGAGIYNAASAAVVVGIMVLPMVASLSEDALRAVSPSLREGAHALGANRFQVTIRVVVPAALSGILASFILALSRAVGETMVVAIAAGSSPNLTLNPLEAIQTMTAYILQAGQGNLVGQSLEYRTLFAVGLVLFIVTMGMNASSQWILLRFKREGR